MPLPRPAAASGLAVRNIPNFPRDLGRHGSLNTPVAQASRSRQWYELGDGSSPYYRVSCSIYSPGLGRFSYSSRRCCACCHPSSNSLNRYGTVCGGYYAGSDPAYSNQYSKEDSPHALALVQLEGLPAKSGYYGAVPTRG